MAPFNQQNENDSAAKVLQELEDRALAEAIAASQREEVHRPTQHRLRYFQYQHSFPLIPDPTCLSAQEKQRQPKEDQSVIEIEGRPVTHDLINRYKNCNRNCDKCRHLMQKVSLLVTETEEWCRENFEVTCYGEHFTRVFWSGARENKMVVQMVAGEVHVTVTEKSRRMWWKNAAQKCWNAIKILGFIILPAAAAAAAASMLGIGGGLVFAIAGCVFTLIDKIRKITVQPLEE